MLRETLQSTVEAAVAALVREGRLPAAVADVPVEISDTKSPEHGDYACNFAMAAAKKAAMNPRALAELIREALLVGKPEDGRDGQSIHHPPSTIHSIDVAGPGFLNLKLRPEAIAAYVPKILAAERFGSVENKAPQRINVEFVSVNPNGPITIGSGRGAAFGSALCNVLQAAGNVVHREYYINDGVNSEQMRQFALSVRFFIVVRIYGEYEDSAKIDMDSADLLDLINTFARANPHLGSAEKADIYDAWLKWANSLSSDDGHLGDLAKIALENHRNVEDYPYYRKDRPGQLQRYIQGAWSSGAFAPPVTEFPAKGYKGDYVRHTADEFVSTAQELTGRLGRDDFTRAEPMVWSSDGVGWFQKNSETEMIARQRGDLAHFGVVFDTWFSEQSLHDRGIVADRIEGLKETGVADEEPYRTKLKLGKGGVIEETIREDQPNEDEGEEESATTDHSPSTTHQDTLWLRSTKFGDDMDRVLRRRDGRLTYIASDVSYHEDKLNRPPNATKMITILGPDHHGYIGRLTAVVAALLRGPEDTLEANAAALTTAKEKLEVVIYQLVRFLKDGKPAPMRKRDGNIYELRDLIDELGKSLNPDGTEDERRTTGRDVARFFYLMRSHDTTMDFDIDLATQQSDENPVFYAQYAHARICSVLRKASGDSAPWSRGDEPASSSSNTPRAQGGTVGEGVHDHRLLTDPRETALVKKILDLPWEVARVAKDYGVHRLATYAVELARTYHHFYDACRVIQPDQPELTSARLALCRATKIALKSTFDLLGVSAPERLDRRAEAATSLVA